VLRKGAPAEKRAGSGIVMPGYARESCVHDPVDWLRDRPYYADQLAAHRRVDAREPTFAPLEVEPRLESALADRGIEQPFRHQSEAIRAVRAGDDVVLATETASGKSLAYTVPAFENAMDHGGRTLYLGPQNALVADQLETLTELAHDLGFGSRVSVEQYTGRLSKSEKQDVRDRRPTVLLSNPDMVHYALLPHAHRLWEWFFESLELVVVDEVHSYRGVFGSHVSMLLRRLNRVCERYGADPQFVCCSATIGNPVEHAATVTGQDPSRFTLVNDDYSGAGPRDWVLWNPPEYERDRGSGRRRSSHTETMRLFVDLVEAGYQTLAFTRSRQTAERYATESSKELRSRGSNALAGRVQAYQGSLTHDRRRELETRLHDGDLRGVWSTNALELGVDVGGLDAVLIDGYPGTRMSAFQQAGRAGRGEEAALVVVVAGEDQLDQYLMRNPQEFFEGEPEEAISNPENAELLPDHLASAAAENWLSTDDERHFGERFPDVVSELEESGVLGRRETENGTRWTHDGDGSPQHSMSLRTIDDREVDLQESRSGDVVASLSFSDALRDAHPGAIYHHQGQAYEVSELDLDRDVATLQPTWADYHTRVLTEKDVMVHEERREKPLSARPDTTVRFADIEVTERVTGFERRDAASGETLGSEILELPETSLRTKGLFWTVPEDVEREMRTMAAEVDGSTGDGQPGEDGDPEYGFNGGIHAAEHGVISLFPLQLLCDRSDIGGLSTPMHPHTDQSTIFIYDGYPGGVGLTRRGYDRIEELMTRTGRLIDDCDCADGCPSCVQSPHCGNANDPLSKAEAVHLLESLTDEG
jgi:DEAD/DEAH box helicase domain-containing protein